MEVWLLRHAAAEARAPSGRDADRALTAEGIERARRVARGLAALAPEIGLVLTSPYRRARQTAEPAARALGLDGKLRESRALEPGRDPSEILEEIAQLEESVLLVGHEPHLGVLLGRLVSGGRGLEIPLKKAAVARVELEDGNRGALRALLPAKVLEKVG
jgi:phosphohistidine phosphatase